MEKSLQRFKTGLYGAFYVLSKEPRNVTSVGKTTPSEPPAIRSTSRLQLAIHSISLLQMLSFCSSPALQWSVTPSLEWLRAITLSISLQDVLPPTLQLLAFYVSVVWSAMFIGLFMWTLRCFIYSSFPVLWPMKLLRAVSDITVAHLYIPILTSLLHVFTCSTDHNGRLTWVGEDGECNTGNHLAASIGAGVFATLMTLLCSLFALVYYENELFSANVQARAHGRAEFLFLVNKSILIVFAQTFPHILGTWTVLCLLLVGALLWLLSIVYWLPFHLHLANQVHAAMAGVFSTCCVMCVFAQLLPEHDAGITFLLCAPPAAAAAILLVNIRAKFAFLTPVQSLPWSVDIELHARYLLHNIMFGHYTDRVRRSNRNSGTESVARQAGGNADASTASEVDVKVLLKKSFSKDSLLLRDCSAFRMMPCCTFMLQTFSSAFVETHIWPSNILWQRNASVRRSMLVSKSTKHAGLWKIHRDHKDKCLPWVAYPSKSISLTRKGTQKPSQQHNWYVTCTSVIWKRPTMEYINMLQRLWTELLEDVPDIYRMHAASRAVYAAEEAAEKAFSQLLALNPQSLLVIRLYAEHCMRLMNDKEKADLLLADAERIDETNKKERSNAAGTHLQMMSQVDMDIMADDTGVMHVSAASNNLGTITQVSPFVCRLLGYSRWQLERRNISCIVPGIIGKAHDNFMRHYAATGEGAVVDYTRSLFAQHRGGYLIPILLCVRETTDEDGSPALVSIMRPLHTAEEYILLSETFGIIGATLRSLGVLDIEGSTLTSHDLSILDWAPELPGLLDELKGGGFCTLCFDTTNAKTVGESMSSMTINPFEQASHSDDTYSEKTWVKARLQEVVFSAGMKVFVLAWTILSNDGGTLVRAETKRRATLVKLAGSNPIAGSEDATLSKHSLLGPTIKLSLPSLMAEDAQESSARPMGTCPFLINRQSNAPSEPSEQPANRPTSTIPHPNYIPEASTNVTHTDTRSHPLSIRIPKEGLQPSSPAMMVYADQESGCDETPIDVPRKDSVVQRVTAMKDTNDQRSVASSNAIRRLGNLRKQLQTKSDVFIKPIRLLRVTGVAVTVVSVILAIGIIVLSSIIYEVYSADITAVTDAGKLMIAAPRMGQVVREFSLAYSGHSVLNANYRLFLMQKLANYTDEFEQLLQRLQELAKAAGISAVYDTSSINLLRYTWDNGLTQIVTHSAYSSLREACFDVLAAARSVLGVDEASLGRATPASELLLATSLRGSQIHTALNDSALTWFRHSNESADVVQAVWLGAYASMCLLIVITCLAIFLPVIIQLKKSRDAVLRQLIQLPESLLRELRKTAERNVNIFAEEDEDMDDSSDDLSDDEGENNNESPHQQSSMEYANEVWMPKFTRSRKDAVESSPNDPNSKLSASVKLSLRTPNSRSPFPLSPSNRPSVVAPGGRRGSDVRMGSKYIARTGGLLAMFTLRLLAPILMLLAFYSVLFGVAEVTLTKTQSLSASMLVSTRRGILSMDVASLLRKGLRTTNNAVAAYDMNRTLTAIADLEYTDRLLTFGIGATVPETTLALGAINGDNKYLTADENAAVYRIMYRDVCEAVQQFDKGQIAIELFSSDAQVRVPEQLSNNVSWAALVDEYDAIRYCRNNLHGSVTHGLHAALLEYTLWSALYARRRADVAVNDTGYGTRSAMVMGQQVGEPYSLHDEFNAPIVQQLRNSGFYYLPAADFAIADLYLGACKDAIAEFVYFESLFAASFLTLFVAAIYFYYLRLLQQENRQIRKQGTLMLLLPVAAFQQHKQLKNFLQELMNINT